MLMALGCGGPARADGLEPWSDKPIPPLVLDSLDGPRTDLAFLRGRPLIVHFFATWCAPCIEEMASLNALAALPLDIGILVVDVGEVEARLRRFFRDRPVSFPVLLDRDRMATKRWRVESLPASFVLDHALQPVLKAREPLDWASPRVVAALTALSQHANGAPAEPAIGKTHVGEAIQ